MIPTSLLKAGGAGLGASAGHALGSIFDAPRQALTNLAINPFAHAQIAAANGKPDDYSWASMLPGAAGLVAGAGSALIPGMAPFAPAIGAGVAGLGQMAADYFDPKTFDAPSTGELVKTLGMDPDSMGGQAAGVGIGALTDPLTYAGGFEGALGGEAVGGARDALAERASQMGQLSDRASGLKDLSGLAQGAVSNFEGTSQNASLLAQLEKDQTRSMAGYRPEVMQALDSVNPLAPLKDKLYKQADPGLAQDLDLLGMGTPQGGGVNLPTGKAPPWAESRGGWLKPTRSREAMLGGAADQLAMPSVLGPNLDRAAGPEGLLQDPMADFARLRGGAEGLGDLRVPTRTPPRLAQALGSSLGDSLYDNPHAMIDDFPVRGMMAKDPDAYVRGNVGSLPLYDARDKIDSMLAQTLQQHDALAGAEPTRLQAMLQKLGLAPR
jgi:hypothetical protein